LAPDAAGKAKQAVILEDVRKIKLPPLLERYATSMISSEAEKAL
jgi:hypothetical protein